MPCPIVGGLITYLTAQLAEAEDLPSYSVWDGGTPRWDSAGNPVSPSNQTGSWPVVSLEMDEGGFGIQCSVGVNSRTERGYIEVHVWGVTREQTENILFVIDGIFADQPALMLPSNVPLGGPSNDPNYIIGMLLNQPWFCRQVEDVKLAASQYLYHGLMRFDTMVHTSANYTGGM